MVRKAGDAVRRALPVNIRIYFLASTQHIVAAFRPSDLGRILDPDVAVPLATNTGWNFRDPSVGNPGELYQLLGSYIPFAPTGTARQATADPRLSVAERYRGADDYLQRVRRSALDLIRRRYLLAEDLDTIVERAKQHWAQASANDVRSR